MATKLTTVAASGFNDWAAAQSGITVISASAIDASNIVVVYNQIEFPTIVNTGSRVEDQPNSGVGTANG